MQIRTTEMQIRTVEMQIRTAEMQIRTAEMKIRTAEIVANQTAVPRLVTNKLLVLYKAWKLAC